MDPWVFTLLEQRTNLLLLGGEQPRDKILSLVELMRVARLFEKHVK